MGSVRVNDYCSFSKALEHLGDRWCLSILGQLVLYGRPVGFNDFANGLPGHISRSVLAEKLRKLDELGLISRGQGRNDPYRLTAVGNALAPTILSLRRWAEAWLPEDPALVERDPDVVLAWLAQRVDATRLPAQLAVMEIAVRHETERRYWLVLERGFEPYGCLEDPLLDQSRYVYVEASITAILALARGRCSWAGSLADGSVVAFGNPELASQLPGWFESPDAGHHPPERALPSRQPDRGSRGVVAPSATSRPNTPPHQ